jgi:ELWxxDGT repeat protein
MGGRRIAGALLLMALAARLGGAAEVPRLLADINTKPPAPDPSANPPLPLGFFQIGDRLFFSTADANSEDEGVLWSTDGTLAGTEAVSSTLCPSPCGGITPVATLGGGVVLKAGRATGVFAPWRLWRTDGTAAGTVPLTETLISLDSETLVEGPSPGSGLLFFAGCRQDRTCALWRTDGTPSGTAPLPGLVPYALPRIPTVWNGKLYLLAEIETLGLGLWATDGTAEGTRFLASVQEASDYEARVLASPVGLFFTSGLGGEDLWVTDGTPGGERLLHDFEPPGCTIVHPHYCGIPDVNSLVALDGGVYFLVHRVNQPAEIWSSDGTASGTRPIIQLSNGVAPDMGSFHRLGSHWIFSVYAQLNTRSLWKADADFSHLEPLASCEGGVCPDALGFLAESPDSKGLLFLGKDPLHGVELWVTDGTGVRRLTDACPGACDGLNSDTYYFSPVLGTFQGRTWFRAFPAETSYAHQDELWTTDGTPTGTRRVAGHTTSVSFFHGLAYFGMGDPSGVALWASDGTPAGTHPAIPLQAFAPGSYPSIVPVRGGALMLAHDGERLRLWRSDGTPAGTVPLAGFEVPSPFGYFTPLFKVGGGLHYFEVYRPAPTPENPNGTRTELWRTNGTSRGTRKVATLNRSQFTVLRTAWAGKLLFLVQEGDKCAFWSSDGTSGGTGEILAMPPGTRCPTAVQDFGSSFLFVARTLRAEGFVPQIFLSDGTPGETRQLSNVRDAREPLYSGDHVLVGGTAFFRLYGRSVGEFEVWRTDGTSAGTRRAFKLLEPASLRGFRGSLYFTAAVAQADGPHGLLRISADGGGPVLLAEVTPDLPRAAVPAGDRLFFVAEDAGRGAELWVTDGTPQGTRPVFDVWPGPESSRIADLTADGNRVFFSANDGEHGRELWVSDGTTAGTRMVWDLNPGGFSSYPQNLVVSGDDLFFAAFDDESGTEPWTLRLERSVH